MSCVSSCADSKQTMTVTVSNPLGVERIDEMVEVAMAEVRGMGASNMG